MIGLLGVALASAPSWPALGELGGVSLHGGFDAQGVLHLQAGDASWSHPAPARGCVGELTLEPLVLRALWRCGATTDQFGTAHRLEVRPSKTAAPPRLVGPGLGAGAVTVRPGIEHLKERVSSALAAGDAERARGLLADQAGRLQYAATDAERADVLLVWLRAARARTNARLAAGDPSGAAAIALDLLQSPPVWEPERPWNYMDRVRIGPPAGNRPAPERAAYLPPTPEAVAIAVDLGRALERGGHADEAIELAKNLARVAPDDAAVKQLAADAELRLRAR